MLNTSRKLPMLYLCVLLCDQGTLPDDWKTANVAPIFKKGDRCKAANYRPVSLTCISCKLMEHVISSSMMRHLDDNGILTDTQHGFRKHRSCESQLISTVHDLGGVKGGVPAPCPLLPAPSPPWLPAPSPHAPCSHFLC